MNITTVRLYLKPSIQKSGKFVDAVVGKLPRNKTMVLARMDGMRCYVPWRLDDAIPEWLTPDLGVITYHPRLPKMYPRISGIYKDQSAVCELMSDVNRLDLYSLEIRARKLEDIRRIFKRIKLGNIRPIPGGSFERPQVGQDEVWSEKKETAYLLVEAA